MFPPPLPEETESIPEPAVTERSISYYAAEKLRAIIGEIGRRRCESLRLYEPLHEQQRFHGSFRPERLLRGSNRGGKTLPATIEVARAITGQDPFGKYPREGGRCIAVGKDGKHCARVMWKKLGRAGAFRIIRDLETGLWRAYRPWQDFERETETKSAPPLLPPRFIKEIAWENKKEMQPSLVRLHNGWEIEFRSSEGKPPQGVDVDLVWFDEEIVDAEWYPEMAARILDRGGKFFWSATPQAATQQLYDLHCRANDKDPLVEEFVILLADNPHIKDEAKAQLAAKLSPEERRVRIEGEFAITSFRVYPEFSRAIHEVEWMHVPEDWMRVAAIDPGRQVLAVLFAAIPPPALNDDHIYFIDELYLRTANAQVFGEAMKSKCAHHSYHTFLIDSHASRMGEIGSGLTVEHQYVEALKRNDVRTTTNGYGFTWGSDDPQAGVLAFRSWLIIRPDGSPRLRVLKGACESFVWESERYHYERVKGMPTDKPQKKNDHLMDCARYIAMYDPKYIEPPKPKKRESYAVAAIKAKAERRRRKDGEGQRHVHLGPGRGAVRV